MTTIEEMTNAGPINGKEALKAAIVKSQEEYMLEILERIKNLEERVNYLENMRPKRSAG